MHKKKDYIQIIVYCKATFINPILFLTFLDPLEGFTEGSKSRTALSILLPQRLLAEGCCFDGVHPPPALNRFNFYGVQTALKSFGKRVSQSRGLIWLLGVSLPITMGGLGLAALFAAAVANEQSQMANQLALLSFCSGNFVRLYHVIQFVLLTTRNSQVVFVLSFSGILTFTYGILQDHYTMLRRLPSRL